MIELTDSGATRGILGWDATGAWVVGGGTPTPGAGTMQPNTDYFCVLRITSVSSGSDTAYLKIYDPTTTTVPIDDAGLLGRGVGRQRMDGERRLRLRRHHEHDLADPRQARTRS